MYSQAASTGQQRLRCISGELSLVLVAAQAWLMPVKSSSEKCKVQPVETSDCSRNAGIVGGGDWSDSEGEKRSK